MMNATDGIRNDLSVVYVRQSLLRTDTTSGTFDSLAANVFIIIKHAHTESIFT